MELNQQTIYQGTQIKKVRVVPVESRRNSLIRAANQTFEYVGFGQGNYSVALPEKQTKVLSTEDRKLGQTQKTRWRTKLLHRSE